MPPESTSKRRTTPVPNGNPKSSPRSSGKCISYPPPSDHGAYSTPFVGIAYETASFVVTLSSLHPCAISSAVTPGRAVAPRPPPLLILPPPNSVQTMASNAIPTRTDRLGLGEAALSPLPSGEGRACRDHGKRQECRFPEMAHPSNATRHKPSADRQIHISPLLIASMVSITLIAVPR